MANTDKILEGILARDKLAAAETTALETPPAACACTHHKEGYALGIQHATEELASRAPVAAPVAPTYVMSVDEVMEGFVKWQKAHGEYYQWEPECLSALRAALVEGDKVHGLFAYTAIIEHADGRREEFVRRPNKVKRQA